MLSWLCAILCEASFLLANLTHFTCVRLLRKGRVCVRFP